MQPVKATRKQLKQHNRHLLLRAVYAGMADNRAALANMTGLAKPTVSELIAELIEDGFMVESGFGESTDSGGKRPRLLNFVPDARQIIGIDLDSQQIIGVLTNLAGDVSAYHTLELNDPDETVLIESIMMVINGLIAQLDAPLLCIGIGSPGEIDTFNGIVRHAESLNWHNLNLRHLIEKRVEIPVYLGNKTELTALAQYAFGTDSSDTQCLVTLLIDTSVEIGFTLQGVDFHRGGDISSIKLNNHRLDTYLGWKNVKTQLEQLRGDYPESLIPEQNYTYLHIRYAAINDDALALKLIDTLAENLADILVWIVGILSPDHVSIAGSIVQLDEEILSRTRNYLRQRISPELIDHVEFTLAYAEHLGALGAVAHALQKELNIL